ncbi:MAG: molybdate ABC transporter substrate-binding protein [Methyloceanibacter sp.]
MLSNTTRRALLGVAAFAAVGLSLLPSLTRADAKGPVVFAAASLKDAIDAADAGFAKESGKQPVPSYAASSTLAKQIEQGAPADIFISADEDWMNYLADRKLIKPDTRFDLLGNTLVLIAPKDSKIETNIAEGFPLATLLGDGHLAMANTDSVPAGKYGKAALTKLGVWDQVKDKIAQADNVRAALKLVSTGEAPLGIVYGTDARSDPNVKVVDTFPEGTHPPIIYPIAITASSTNADAPALLAYLKSSAAQSLFKDQGFKVLLNY